MRHIVSCLMVAGLVVVPLNAQFPLLPPGILQLLAILGGGAKEITQVANHAALLSIYIRQAEQLKQEIQLVADSLKNLKNVGPQSFSTVMSDIDMLDGLIGSSKNLGYSVGDIEQRFLEKFPGYLPVGQAARRGWLEASLDTSRAVLKAANKMSAQRQNTAGLLSILKGQSNSSEGHLQAMQVLGQMGHETVGQLERLQQVMLSSVSANVSYQSAMLQEQAAAAAASEKFFDYKEQSMDQPGFTCCKFK